MEKIALVVAACGLGFDGHTTGQLTERAINSDCLVGGGSDAPDCEQRGDREHHHQQRKHTEGKPEPLTETEREAYGGQHMGNHGNPWTLASHVVTLYRIVWSGGITGK